MEINDAFPIIRNKNRSKIKYLAVRHPVPLTTNSRVPATTWSMSSNAVFVTNYILARPVDVWETDFVNIYVQLELLTRTSQLHGISHHMDTPLRTCLFPQSSQASKAPWTGAVLRPNSYLNTGLYIQVASILTFILFKTLKSARASYIT